MLSDILSFWWVLLLVR